MHRYARMLAVAILAGALLTASGCGKRLTSISDSSGLFHVNVPEQWQSLSQTGLLALYAAKELPKDDTSAFDTLSVGIYVASDAATEAVDARLAGLLKARAKDRGWKKVTYGKSAPAKLGSRSGQAIDVSGTDAKSRGFAGRAVLVRTNDREVLVFAVAPAKKWDGYQDEVEDLLTNWYWHEPADDAGSAASSTTP